MDDTEVLRIKAYLRRHILLLGNVVREQEDVLEANSENGKGIQKFDCLNGRPFEEDVPRDSEVKDREYIVCEHGVEEEDEYEYAL